MFIKSIFIYDVTGCLYRFGHMIDQLFIYWWSIE
jgi:hypothetical protein